MPSRPLDRRREGFSAGQDLSDRAVAPSSGRPDLGEFDREALQPADSALRALPKPIVCAVNGAAAGAGANIALACDIVLAAKSARFLQAFARIGLVPDSGGTWILPRLVGEARARALMMLADPIGAEQAEAWGMIYRAVDDDQLMGVARETAMRLAAGPTHALRSDEARSSPRRRPNSLDAQLDLERDLQREAGQPPTNRSRACARSWRSGPANFRDAKSRTIDARRRSRGKSADPLWAEDNTAARSTGFGSSGWGPGEAALSMVVTEAMTNGHGIGHGGFIFLLADTAFAYACNSYNQRCVAQHCSISYLKPAGEGSRLDGDRTRSPPRRSQRHLRHQRHATSRERRSRNSGAISRTVPGSFF